MPTIIVPTCFLDSEDYSSREVEIWSEKCLVRELREDLMQQHPQLATKYHRANGEWTQDWFALMREEDEYSLEDTMTILRTDRVFFINQIGC